MIMKVSILLTQSREVIRMKNFLIAVAKTAFATLLLAVAFWPNGLGWYIITNFLDRPLIYTVIIAIWFGLVVLNLPFSRTGFTKLSSLSLAVISAVIMFRFYELEIFQPSYWEHWLISAIAIGGIMVGWWTNATKVWKWYRHITAVDDPDTSSD